ncbi:Retrovirus-related Pol polyprotein from transposon RE2 [Glycine soja]|uniref:Retrovirus-related Pol polyprotein from transposon RE2 n=1 Tax=Glycine soja TaxID=3848 RepID=A0A445LSH7_GLYSO|nr:Retrovirus-related Pol polyprotein from transposon RE2 [Glycine soja]
MEIVWLVIAFTVERGWAIHQLDVKSTFLHGELAEDVFVEQPCGYVQKGNEEKVYKLKKALYGLKQAPHAWYNRIEAYFVKEDLMFVVSLLNRYLEHPTQLHLHLAKRVLGYIQGTTEFGIFYKKGGSDKLIAYSDSDYARDVDDKKSTTGNVFLFGSAAISWCSKKQPIAFLDASPSLIPDANAPPFVAWELQQHYRDCKCRRHSRRCCQLPSPINC